MTKRAKWLEVAEAFGTAESARSGEQERLAAMGLCNAYMVVGDNDRDDTDDSVGMYRQVMAFTEIGRNSNDPFYCAPIRTPESDDLRCLVACLFVAMTDGERGEVLRAAWEERLGQL